MQKLELKYDFTLNPDILSHLSPSANKQRWTAAGPIPDKLTPVKGSVHVVVNRDFVQFIVEDPRAKRLLDWVRPQKVADETFFATIGHNPSLGLRGTFIG